MACLPDVNVLFALLHPGHAHSETTREWFERDRPAADVAICRVVQMGALRLLTSPTVMGVDVQHPREFWSGWDRAMTDERLVEV